MSRIVTSPTDSPSIEDLYEKYKIQRRFDQPASITEETSAFGDGKYPPDWNANREDIEDAIGGRRDAVLEYQGYECARCRRDLHQANYFNCHHYRPISEGGKHDLTNLVVLCGPCHKLIHPNVDQLDAAWQDAPLFPSPRADPRMATIRRPVTEKEREQYLPELKILASTSKVGENEFANSEATIPVSPGDALSAAADFTQLLEDAGIQLDGTFGVRASNQRDGPIFGATVELEVTVPGGHSFGLTDETGPDGMAEFTVPRRVSIRGRVSKDEFDDKTFSADPNGDEILEVRLTPKDGAAAGTTPSPEDASTTDTRASESSGVGRRSVIAAAALGLGGLLIWDRQQGTIPFAGNLLEGSSKDAAMSTTASETQEPSPSWIVDVEPGAAFKALSISNGTILSGLQTGKIYGHSLDGEELWNADIRDRLGDVSVVDGTAYVCGRQTVHAVTDGNVGWSTRIEEADPETEISVAVGESNVLATYYDESKEGSSVAVLDRESGERRRMFHPEVGIHYATAFYDSRFLLTTGDSLYAYEDVETSDPITVGTVPFERSGQCEDIFLHEDRAYVPLSPYSSAYTYDTRLYAFDVASMTRLWNEPTSEEGLGSVVANEGSVYYSDSETAIAFDDSGVRRWELEEYAGTVSPAVLGDTVFFGGQAADEWVLSANATADGASRYVVRDFETELTATASTDSHVIVGTAGGKLYSYGAE